jgi:hypothetical protein
MLILIVFLQLWSRAVTKYLGREKSKENAMNDVYVSRQKELKVPVLFRDLIEETNQRSDPCDEAQLSIRKFSGLKRTMKPDEVEPQKKRKVSNSTDEEEVQFECPPESSLPSLLTKKDWEKYDLQLQEVDHFIRDLQTNPLLLTDKVLSQRLHELVDDELLTQTPKHSTAKKK